MSSITKNARSRAPSSIGRQIEAIRGGDHDQLGRLLQSFQNYLRVLADMQLDQKLRGRLSASDLVQETLLGACRDFQTFRGNSEAELLAWLRAILINNLHNFVQQHVTAAKRDVRRECSLHSIGAGVEQSAVNLGANLLRDAGPSPSGVLSTKESVVALADTIATLPEDQQQVLILRNLQGKRFAEVAAIMDRTEGATRMLWLRAIQQLKQRMPREQERES
ncbi:MAG: sigma-70 family RNA polymerase sigma factor [Pirellulaceae bacterium]|jgi:RNA polymerase sigma-70 factor (ECF subfamily)|nr:sigma-70 family RNA polymerase sigma factor [Pirellulaceae bacterium]MDP7015762.1 sigma-70 family RNA polymerase sigma factor [Pirellulaceae bacterium]